MAFKFPGLDVALFTVLWIVLGGFGVWQVATVGSVPWYLAVCIVTGLAALGMWFQVPSAGYIFGSINVLLTLIGLLGLVFSGFEIKLLFKVITTTAAAITAFQWAAAVED